MAQSDLSMQNQDFLTWFNRYYTIQDGSVQARASLGLPEGAYVPRPRKTGIRKTPPNPPLAQKCALCKDFSHAGSTMNYIRSTCRDCGHVEQKPREVTYTHDPATCRHEVVDRRGSSRSISRTFCKQCGTFIDEVPGEFHAKRRAAASKVLDAKSNALDVINAMTNKEAVTDCSPEAVEAILGAFVCSRLSKMRTGSMILSCTTTSGKPLPKPWKTLIPHGVMSVVHPQHLLL